MPQNNVFPRTSENQPMVNSSQPKDINTPTPDWATYTNKIFAFSFQYPSSWKIVDNTTKPPGFVPVSLIIMTEGHPINRAGYLALIDMAFDQYTQLYLNVAKKNNDDIVSQVDLSKTNLHGTGFIVKHSSGQTDYEYHFSLNNRTLKIIFSSISSDKNKIINDALRTTIETFANTFKQTGN